MTRTRKPAGPDSGVLLVRNDGDTIDIPAGLAWPGWLAGVAEHCARAQIGDWPAGEEAWWPTQKAMQDTA